MVYSAAGNQIYAWRRGCELKHIYKGHEHPVKLLLPFGPHLISIDVKSQLKVLHTSNTIIYDRERITRCPMDMLYIGII